MSAELTIVFVSCNSTRLLDRALRSLDESEHGLAIEKIVVDNASRDRDDLVDVCRRNRARLLLLHRNVGYGAAFNRGWRIARGRFIAVANPDLEFSSGTAGAMVRFLDENQRAGAVSPQLCYADGLPQPTARRYPRLRYVLAGRRSPILRFFPHYAAARSFQCTDIHLSRSPVQVEAVIGAFVVFRREALDAVRGFDEGFFMYAEDLDISRRMTDAGWGVYVDPRRLLLHHYGAVRRQARAFSDYQRLRALRRLFRSGRMPLSKVLLDIAFAGYLSTSAVGWLVGLGEYERSWQLRRGG